MAYAFWRSGRDFSLYAALLLNSLSASGSLTTTSPLVAIDIGHTVQAPGATSARGVSEYQFNRLLADAIVSQMRSDGLRAFLVNSNGRIASLTDRTALAKRSGAGFLLSIHHDSVQPQYLRSWSVDGIERLRSEGRNGFSLFVSNRNPDPDASMRCASAIGVELRKSGFTPSRYHAESIAGENRPFADEINGVHYYDGLAVLRTSSSPAVLLEAGVISDPNEELVIGRATTREAMGKAVTAGLRKCLTERFHERNPVRVGEEKQ